MTARSEGAPPPSPPAVSVPGRSHREIRTVFLGLCTAMLLAALEQTVVATALPTIVGELGGLQHLSWVVTAYLLSATVTVPLYGKISDLFGRKKLFLGAITVFIVGAAACAMSGSMLQLVLARGVQGVGAGGIMALSQTIIGDVVSPRERGRYIGYIGAVFGFSSVVGPLVGGFFVEQLHWRWVFVMYIPLGLLAMFVIHRFLKLPVVRRRQKVDFLGATLLISGVGALLLVATWGGEQYPWRSPQILGLSAFAAVALAVFAVVERRVTDPILPFSLLTDRVVGAAVAVSFVVGACLFGVIIYLPTFLQVVTGVSPTESGLLIVPLMAGFLLTSTTSGRLITRWGRYKVYPIVGTATLTVGLGLMATVGAGTPPSLVMTFGFVIGFGIGAVMQVMVMVVQNAVPFEHLGTATSATQFFRQIGGTFGVTVFGALINAQLGARMATMSVPDDVDPATLLNSPAEIAALDASVRGPLQHAIADSISSVFAVAFPLGILAFALTWLIKEVPLRTTVGDNPSAQEGRPQRS